jgi:hypothetical protein
MINIKTILLADAIWMGITIVLVASLTVLKRVLKRVLVKRKLRKVMAAAPSLVTPTPAEAAPAAPAVPGGDGEFVLTGFCTNPQCSVHRGAGPIRVTEAELSSLYTRVTGLYHYYAEQSRARADADDEPEPTTQWLSTGLALLRHSIDNVCELVHGLDLPKPASLVRAVPDEPSGGQMHACALCAS